MKPTKTSETSGTKGCRIYLRFSSTQQQDGTSEERQKERCYARAASEGFHVIKEYFDRGVSAAEGLHREKEFGRLLKDLKAGEWVIVENLDRLSRENLLLKGSPIADILNRGASLMLANGERFTPENINEAEKQFSGVVGAVLASVGNVRRNELVKKAYALKYAQLEAGEKPLMPFYPSWIMFHKYEKRYVLVEQKAEVVRTIFRMYLQGTGTTTIAQHLNKKNIPQFRKGKASWMQAHVWQILRNPAAIGTLTLKGKAYPDYFPSALENKDDFYRTQDQIKVRTGKRRGRIDRETVRNLFRGIGKCKCGQSIWAATNSKGNGYYRCHGRYNGASDCDGAMKMEDVEYAFLRAVASHISKELHGNEGALKKVQALEARIAEVKDQQRSTAELLLQKVAVDVVSAQLAKLQAKEDGLRKDLEALKAQNASLEKMPENTKVLLQITGKGLWENSTRRKINDMLPTMFSGITFDLEGKRISAQFRDGKTFNWEWQPPFLVDGDTHGGEFVQV